MSWDFLSGLVLAVVVFATLGYIVREMLGGPGSAAKLRGVLKAHAGGEAKSANDHLIGTAGRVIGHADDAERPLRVQLGIESWPARPSSTDTPPFAIGDEVRVLAVDGPVAVVAAAPGQDGAGSADTDPEHQDAGAGSQATQ